MDVRQTPRLGWLVPLCVCLNLGLISAAEAAPSYSLIDLGTGPLAYGTGSNGSGTVTGSTGLTYSFTQPQNDLPARWANTTAGVPIVYQAPINDQMTYGNPNNAYSYSNLLYMNSQGLAVGVNNVGIKGHLGSTVAFVTQLGPNGTWGAPTSMWAGPQTFAEAALNEIKVYGISSSGQVLGVGAYQDSYMTSGQGATSLYVFDTKSGSLININNLVGSAGQVSSAPPSWGSNTHWDLVSVIAQLDDQGRVLVLASDGFGGPTHNLLLVPDGVSTDPVSVPEPATWSIFVTLIGGFIAVRRWPAQSRRANRRAS